MNGPRFDLVVFDFDGTLADTKLGIALATNAMLLAMQLPELPNETIYPLIGMSLRTSVGMLLEDAHPGQAATDAEIDRAVALYSELYPSVSQAHDKLFPGVREGLDQLVMAGVTMAIATSKSSRGIRRMMASLALEGYFQHWVADDMVTRKKPAPEMLDYLLGETGRLPASSLMVGDTSFDIEMGNEAGLVTCAVTYGVHPRARLVAAGAQHLADDFAGVTGLVL
ncbi:MAG: HAD family hydrolase [Candidatus Melainabacteria bacterium]